MCHAVVNNRLATIPTQLYQPIITATIIGSKAIQVYSSVMRLLFGIWIIMRLL